MSKRRRNHASGPPVTKTDVSADERLRPLWLGAVTALFVATPLIPSEAAPKGLGVSLLMAWFTLAAAFVVAGAMQGKLRLRVGATDLALLVFIALHTLSALVLADAGQPRQTLNMLWQWVGFGVAFFLLRHVVRTAPESRAVVAVMIALAVCLSMHGYYQYFQSMPEARRQFEADDDGSLVKQGFVPLEGSVEYKQFVNRLYSTEPLATFTLANSLAGFLAAWLLCVGGIGAFNWSNRDLRWRLTISAGLSTLLIAGCFLLTKSRTATLAVLCGVVMLAVLAWRNGWRPGWKLLVAAIGAPMVLVLLGVSVGGLDLKVLTESSKSFLYRVQYWQSSVAMIADAPWFGCGPGNFQETYTAYKLPEASETVADPHNFLLEIWATAGTPAMIAFLAIGLCFAFRLCCGASTTTTDGMPDEQDDIGCVRAVYWGALAGVPFGFVAGLVVNYLPDTALFVVGLPVAVAVTVGWHSWVLRGRLPIAVLVASSCALLINLLAAGGISFAGVTLTLWLMLAIALNQSEEFRFSQALSGRSAATMAAVVVLLAGVFWYSTFAPTLNVSTSLALAGDLQRQGNLQEADQELLRAAAADSYSAAPWQALAELRLAMWLDRGDASREADFLIAARETLARHRRSRAAHQTYGDWHLRAYRATGQERFLDEAIEGYRRAVELYPNYNLGHAQLAWALQVAGRTAESRTEAEEALRLDELNPHREQKLAEQVVFDVPPASDSQTAKSPDVDAEQLMRSLRSSPDN